MTSEDDIRELVTRLVDEAVEEGRAEESRPAGRRVAVGADHGGFQLKQKLIAYLRDRGFEVTDCGTDSAQAADYPLIAGSVAAKVASDLCDCGIIIDGAGIGSSIAANKVPGVRAALCYDISSARNSREHNHANVLTLGAGLIGESLAYQIVEAWLTTAWGGGRHARRVAMIDELEARYRGDVRVLGQHGNT